MMELGAWNMIHFIISNDCPFNICNFVSWNRSWSMLLIREDDCTLFYPVIVLCIPDIIELGVEYTIHYIILKDCPFNICNFVSWNRCWSMPLSREDNCNLFYPVIVWLILDMMELGVTYCGGSHPVLPSQLV
jgi:hypothetical protein